jgi:MSHA biogenesis protein MshI
MQRTARQLEQQVDTQGRRLAGLDGGEQSPDSVALDEEIAQLTNEIERRNTLMVQFDQLSNRQDSGFAERFEALAGEQLPGLWLEAVSMDSDNRIELRGIALDARLVPNYVQQLDRSSGLSAQPFETVSVTRLDSDAPQLQFVLRNFKGEATWN